MAIRLEVTKMPLFHNIFKDKENKKKEIRIPKVPIVLSEYDDEIDFEEEEKDKVLWIDLYTFLFEAGIVLLSDKLNKEKGKIILGIIFYLAILHPMGELHLVLNNCVSGCLRTALTMHDAIQQLPRPGHTVGVGMTASVGSLILVSGHERLAQPNTRILIQKPKFNKIAIIPNFPIKRKKKTPGIICDKRNGQKKDKEKKRQDLRRYSDVHEAIKQFDSLTEYFHEIFVGKTGQSYDIIQKDLKENVVMSAKEAQDYGIIDRITTDFQIQSLLHETLLPNFDENFEENGDDTPGWR